MDDINQIADPSETSPLLEPTGPKSEDRISVDNKRTRSQAYPFTLVAFVRKWRVILICIVFMVVIDFGTSFMVPARLRMLEAMICRRYYSIKNPSLIDRHNDVPERFCKLDPIQEELAYLNALKSSIDAVISVIFAIPWGVLADKKDRRLVATLCVFGMVLNECWYIIVAYCWKTLPPKALFAGGAFLMIGGGAPVFSGAILGIIADFVPPDTRAIVLFQVQGCLLGTLIFGPPLGAIALKRLGYWIPSLIGYIVAISSMPLLFWMPMKPKLGEDDLNRQEGNAEAGRIITADPPDDIQTNCSSLEGLKSRVNAQLANMREVLVLATSRPALSIGLFLFILTKAGTPISEFIPQYVSKRFDMSISDSSYISVVQSVFNVVLLLLIIPAVTRLLKTKYEIEGPPLDLKMLQGSIVFLIIGCALLGIADSLALFIIALIVKTIGVGYRATLESFLSSLIRHDQMATLYVSIAVVDTLGSIMIYPLLMACFTQGLHMGGRWIGLPFIVSSVFYLLSGILTACLRLAAPGSAE